MTIMLFASTTYAQLGATLNSATGIDGAVGGKVDTAVDANINANVNANPKAGLGAEVDVGLNANSKIEADASSNLNVNNATEGNASATLEVNASGIAITSAVQVSSEDDLNVFSSNIVLKNTAVAHVDMNSENTAEMKITVVYRNKGRFLGFIPVTIKSTTVVGASGGAEASVKSSLPWWSFLVAGENYNRVALESSIKNSPTIQANAKVNASAQAKAHIAETVIVALQTNATAQANANIR